MAQVKSVEAQNMEYQKVEELFEYRDAEGFDTIMLNGPIDSVRENLKLPKDQGTNIQNIYQSYFHFFSIDQKLNYPEFVDWCANNYYLFERVIMDITSSTVLFPIIPLAIRKTLSFPKDFTLKS